MRALSKLIFGGDSYYDERGKSITPEPAVLEVGMSEADFSNRNLGAGGAIIIAAWITHKDRGPYWCCLCKVITFALLVARH